MSYRYNFLVFFFVFFFKYCVFVVDRMKLCMWVVDEARLNFDRNTAFRT